MSLIAGRKPGLAYAIIWLLLAGLLLFLSRDNVATLSGWDPDDQLRLVQLRDFLGGQSWWDSSQYRLNAPDGAPMHWSRLIELPLAAIILALRPLLGTYGAEMAAGIIVPFGLLCPHCGNSRQYRGADSRAYCRRQRADDGDGCTCLVDAIAPDAD